MKEKIIVVLLLLMRIVPSLITWKLHGMIEGIKEGMISHEQDVIVQTEYIVCLPMNIRVDDIEQTTDVSLNCDYGSNVQPWNFGTGQKQIKGSFGPSEE